MSRHKPERLLRPQDVPTIKGMLGRGDLQSDIAAFFGLNGGRIAEISTGARFPAVEAASASALPPTGPYPAARSAVVAKAALLKLRKEIDDALAQIDEWEKPSNG